METAYNLSQGKQRAIVPVTSVRDSRICHKQPGFRSKPKPYTKSRDIDETGLFISADKS